MCLVLAESRDILGYSIAATNSARSSTFVLSHTTPTVNAATQKLLTKLRHIVLVLVNLGEANKNNTTTTATTTTKTKATANEQCALVLLIKTTTCEQQVTITKLNKTG